MGIKPKGKWVVCFAIQTIKKKVDSKFVKENQIVKL